MGTGLNTLTAMANAKPTVFVESLLYAEATLAAVLEMSVSQLQRKVRSGEVPAPDVHLDSRPRWSKCAIERWVKAGCPSVGKTNGKNRKGPS